MSAGDEIRVRLDKWLWAARFYKTRSLATEAIAGGKVEVNGDRAKPSKAIKPGDEVRVRLVDVPLTQLAIGESRPMPHQLVGQRATDSLEEHGVVRVLEDAAMALLLDVLEVLARGAARRIFLAHIAKPPRELGELLTIGALAKPVDAEMLGLDERRTGEECEARLGIVQRVLREKGNSN